MMKHRLILVCVGIYKPTLQSSRYNDMYNHVYRLRALERLEITWPEGSQESFEGLAAGATYVVERGVEGRPASLRALD